MQNMIDVQSKKILLGINDESEEEIGDVEYD